MCSGLPRTSGQTSPAPVASTGRRSGQFGTLLGATGGYPNTLAPNGGKLGRLRCARQGLVRVPESNTKYGGKRGITGGNAASVMAPSISESSGIPKEKKLCGHPPSMLAPVVHRGRFLFPAQACLGETHGRLRGSFGGHVGIPVVLRSHHRQAAADSLIAYPPPHDRISAKHGASADRARRPCVPRRHLGELGP